MRRHLLVSTLAAVFAACAPAPYSGGLAPSSEVLLAPEIVKARVQDTYQAVSQLRPQFLKVRGPLIPAVGVRKGLRVYLDDIDVGGVDALRTIPIDQVTAIRYFTASDAQFRWGSDHPSGVILVSTTHVIEP